MDKKYELTDEMKIVEGRKLYRIRALKDFGRVSKGELGGFVENEGNLSQNDDCWIYDNGKVYGNGIVFGSGKVFANAEVFGNGKVFDRGQINDNGKVFGNVMVYGNGKVCDNGKVYDNGVVCGKGEICDNCIVCDKGIVHGDAKIQGNAVIKNINDYIVFQNNWSSGRFFTWTKSNNMWSVGCFYGTGKELIEKAYKDSEESGRKYAAYVNFVEDNFLQEEVGKTNDKI